MGRQIYCLWPAVHARPLEVSDPATLARHVLNVAVVAAALCLPPVTHATGIRPLAVVGIIAAHLVWTVSVMFVLRPSAPRSAGRLQFALAGSIVLNTAIVVAFPVLGSDPQTPLWMLAVMYACFNGSIQEIEPSIGALLIHVVTPVLAIPLFLASGANAAWSIGAPLLCSAVSGIAYNHLAHGSAGAREQRHAKEQALAVLRAELDDGDRARLARDIHDSLGSSLAIVGLFGDLIEQNVNRPDELRSVARMVREAAHEGRAELSALVSAIKPASTNVDAVADAIAETGQRASLSNGTEIDVRVLGGGDMQLDGTLRLALIRVFQESLHNSIAHGAVRRIEVCLRGDDDAISIEITDDGVGFDPTDAPTGRGLSGMRARVSDLGGTFTLRAAPGAGTSICVVVPRSRDAAP